MRNSKSFYEINLLQFFARCFVFFRKIMTARIFRLFKLLKNFECVVSCSLSKPLRVHKLSLLILTMSHRSLLGLLRHLLHFVSSYLFHSIPFFQFQIDFNFVFFFVGVAFFLPFIFYSFEPRLLCSVSHPLLILSVLCGRLFSLS